MTNKQQLFRRVLLLGHQQNKGRGQNVKTLLSKIMHNIYGNQSNNNSKVNTGHSFEDTGVKLCHSKVVRPNKISLSYPQCFNVTTCKDPVSKKSNSRCNSSRETKIILFKFKYPKYCSRIRDSFSRKPCSESIPQPPVLNQEKPKLVKKKIKEILFSQYRRAKINISAISFLYQRGIGATS